MLDIPIKLYLPYGPLWQIIVRQDTGGGLVAAKWSDDGAWKRREELGGGKKGSKDQQMVLVSSILAIGHDADHDGGDGDEMGMRMLQDPN